MLIHLFLSSEMVGLPTWQSAVSPHWRRGICSSQKWSALWISGRGCALPRLWSTSRIWLMVASYTDTKSVAWEYVDAINYWYSPKIGAIRFTSFISRCFALWLAGKIFWFKIFATQITDMNIFFIVLDRWQCSCFDHRYHRCWSIRKHRPQWVMATHKMLGINFNTEPIPIPTLEIAYINIVEYVFYASFGWDSN